MGLYWGYLVLYKGSIRIMEKKMETTIVFRVLGLRFKVCCDVAVQDVMIRCH